MRHVIDLTALNPTESKAILGELRTAANREQTMNVMLQPSATGGRTLAKKGPGSCITRPSQEREDQALLVRDWGKAPKQSQNLEAFSLIAMRIYDF